jgi:voltage-gated potassium channel
MPNETAMDEYRTIGPHPTPWRAAVYHVIFGTDTWPGKLFDITLLAAILASVLAVSLETVESLSDWHDDFVLAEIVFTMLFTVEYILRLICVRRPIRYARSFFGVIDLMSFLPTYLSLLVPGTKLLVVLRTMRLLRLFRIFELSRFLREAESLSRAIWDARARVAVFLLTVLIAVTIAGTAMYLIEHERTDSQFTSIPQSMYWAVVTMTTVGYGDVVPQTAPGKVLSAVLILLGYSLIIVPTGFVSAELVSGARQSAWRECPHCLARGHQEDARFCRHCAGELP